ncbi:MAG TPA: CYTH and CHAD domain-containing protein [Acidimicrobiales bacterium]|jgi:CHAD domain-containing protein|nr:CYTH and CHAD domain-containing protein [Acidimicrobiales bacterium]
MTRTDHLEREVKLAADLHFTLPDLRPIVGTTTRLPAQALRTIYFDTADLRLWGQGITLRHREGEDGGEGLWTMKLPEKAARSELQRTELSWPGARPEVPVEAVAILKGVVRRAVLREAVSLESVRKRLLLGQSFGEIDDDVVTVTSGSRQGYVFRQIELEFGTGEDDAESDAEKAHAVLDQFRRAGARVDDQQKFTKALDLDPTRTVPNTGHRVTIGSAIELSIRTGLDRLLEHDVRLRVSPTDPPQHSVHRARVATRRLRSDLKTFSGLLDPVWLDHTTRELRWLGALFGRVRDIDVLAQRVVALATHGRIEQDGSVELSDALVRERRGAAFELGGALEGSRYLDLLERLATAAALPPLCDQGTELARDAFPALVGRQFRALRRRVRHGGRHPDDAQLHRIRIGAKQLRYAAEAASPFVGKSARRTAKQAKKLQTILGEHHDAVTAESWLRQAAEKGSSLAGFTAGALVAHAQQEKADRAERWKKVWDHARDGSRWLHL